MSHKLNTSSTSQAVEWFVHLEIISYVTSRGVFCFHSSEIYFSIHEEHFLITHRLSIRPIAQGRNPTTMGPSTSPPSTEHNKGKSIRREFGGCRLLWWVVSRGRTSSLPASPLPRPLPLHLPKSMCYITVSKRKELLIWNVCFPHRFLVYVDTPANKSRFFLGE